MSTFGDVNRDLNEILDGTGATTQNGNEIWALDRSFSDHHVYELYASNVPIEYLMASGTRITDQCLKVLSSFPLVDLSIANTSVTSSAVLSTSWPATLTNFALSGISFRSQCVKSLARLPRLSVLNVSSCKMTPTQLDEICDGSSVSFIVAAGNRIRGVKACELSQNWPNKQFYFSDGVWQNGVLITMPST